MKGRTGRKQNTTAAATEQTEQAPVDDQPRELPAELWGSCLQNLFLQGNRIKWLPDYVGKFSSLTRLDISG